jgi:hypothetical protein
MYHQRPAPRVDTVRAHLMADLATVGLATVGRHPLDLAVAFQRTPPWVARSN